MNIWEIEQTMIDKGIPANVMAQFVFPETKDETPKDKIEFTKQMDELLNKEQIISVMAEQGCCKNEPTEEFMSQLTGKSIEERIRALNAMGKNKAACHRLNEDGTLSIFWDFEENGKYRCVCSTINELPEHTTVSLTYCGCCSGHVKYHSENFLGVKLRLLEIVSSPISSNGEKYCEHLFEIIDIKSWR